jgi:hypothetical protein
MLQWDGSRFINPPREHHFGDEFEVRDLFYSPALRRYLERHARFNKFSRWEHVRATPRCFLLITNKHLSSDRTD